MFLFRPEVVIGINKRLWMQKLNPEEKLAKIAPKKNIHPDYILDAVEKLRKNGGNLPVFEPENVQQDFFESISS